MKAGRALPKGFGGLRSWGPAPTPAPPELTQESSTVQTSHGLPEALPGEKRLAEGKGRRGLTEADLLSSQSCGFPRQEEDTAEAGGPEDPSAVFACQSRAPDSPTSRSGVSVQEMLG